MHTMWYYRGFGEKQKPSVELADVSLGLELDFLDSEPRIQGKYLTWEVQGRQVGGVGRECVSSRGH